MKINEVEKQLNISSYTLRYYEKMNLIKPQRDENGYRHYSEEDIKKLNKIRFLREMEIPLGDIQAILSEEKTFQDVLKEHLKTIDLQMQSLQVVKELCQKLNAQELPLMEDFIEKQQMNKSHELEKTKNTIQKIFGYFKGSNTVVIGARCQLKDLLGYIPFGIAYSILIGALIGIGIPNIFGYVNNAMAQSSKKIYIPVFESNPFSVTLIMTAVFILLMIKTIWKISKQDYIELTDHGLMICSYRYQDRKNILKSMLAKKDNPHNIRYKWQDIDHVEIKLYFQSMTAYRGFWTVYVPEFHFIFKDDFRYNITSGLSFGEDSRTAYQILRCKNVEIYAQDDVIGYYEQDELKGYDYFEKIYHKNSRKS